MMSSLKGEASAMMLNVVGHELGVVAYFEF